MGEGSHAEPSLRTPDFEGVRICSEKDHCQIYDGNLFRLNNIGQARHPPLLRLARVTRDVSGVGDNPETIRRHQKTKNIWYRRQIYSICAEATCR